LDIQVIMSLYIFKNINFKFVKIKKSKNQKKIKNLDLYFYSDFITMKDIFNWRPI
jgi:hypothetical protein